MKLRQRKNEKNGAAERPLDEAELRQMVEDAELQKDHEFAEKYQQLCQQYGRDIHAEPVFTQDGRVSVSKFVRRTQKTR